MSTPTAQQNTDEYTLNDGRVVYGLTEDEKRLLDASKRLQEAIDKAREGKRR